MARWHIVNNKFDIFPSHVVIFKVLYEGRLLFNKCTWQDGFVYIYQQSNKSG